MMDCERAVICVQRGRHQDRDTVKKYSNVLSDVDVTVAVVAVFCKFVPDMTYNVFGGMLSITQSINQSFVMVYTSRASSALPM